MAIDRFKWPVQIQDANAANPQYSVRKIEFGDGYDQTAENGINSRRISFPLSQVEDYATAKEMVDFLGRHVITPFIFPVPLYGDGLYQVEPNSINAIALAGGGNQGRGKLFHVTATLKESAGFGGNTL